MLIDVIILQILKRRKEALNSSQTTILFYLFPFSIIFFPFFFPRKIFHLDPFANPDLWERFLLRNQKVNKWRFDPRLLIPLPLNRNKKNLSRE